MNGALVNHLWQSTLFAVGAALLITVLRRNGAHVRYWTWLAASLKFVVPFSVLVGLGRSLSWVMPVRTSAAAAASSTSMAVQQFTEPFATLFPAATSTPHTSMDWTRVALGVWACGVAAIVLLRVREWLRIRAAVAASRAIEIAGVDATVQIRSSPALLEPGIVGVWRPILLVPDGIEQYLTARQLEAVLAHELCHLQRCDNVTAALHMVVETLFWFHPLVWWISARLLDERERACDEHVLRMIDEPKVYAEGILRVCRRYVELPLACVSGVTGSHLKRRIEDIMFNRTGVQLNPARRAMLAIVATTTLAVPVVTGMAAAPRPSQPDTSTARFNVASVKPCETGSVPSGGRGGGGNFTASPGTLHIRCMSVEQLVDMAYVSNGESLLNDGPGSLIRSGGAAAFVTDRIRGGPAWARSDKYEIDARAAGAPDRTAMMGPMLRALLEERFQLRIRREIDDIPMYALKVAKGGAKITEIGPDGGCIPWDRATQTPPPMNDVMAMIRRGEKPPCNLGVMGGENGPNKTLALGGQNLDGVAYWLSSVVDRRVLNATGIEGRFNLYLEFAPDEHTPWSMARTATGVAAFPASGPTIFAAVEQQLGLTLEPTMGPREFLVIDHVEPPTLDGLAAGAQPSARTMEAALRGVLFELRTAIDRYHSENGQYPPSLEAMVSDGYLSAIPEDPVTRAAAWRTVPAPSDPARRGAAAAIRDVRSTSDDFALDGTKYSDW
jgi:uncharacterized protein (TIGR03435 family)